MEVFSLRLVKDLGRIFRLTLAAAAFFLTSFTWEKEKKGYSEFGHVFNHPGETEPREQTYSEAVMRVSTGERVSVGLVCHTGRLLQEPVV